MFKNICKIIIRLFIFAFIVGVSLYLPLLHFPLVINIIFITISWILGIIVYINDKKLFIPTLFFLINSILTPFSIYVLKTFSIQVPHLYFLLSMIVYLIIVLSIKQFRKYLTWLKWGKFDKLTIIFIILIAFISASALFLWAYFIKKDLTEYKEFIPKIPLILLIIYGAFFPVFNAIFEEFISRAVLYDGFFYISRNVIFVIISQALIFAFWHFNGFPGGIIGIILVFIWSIFLGIIRYRSRGILAPLIAHFFADLSIAIIILFLIVIPARSGM